MAVKAKGYKLVPAEVPHRQRTSMYADIIEDFRASDAESALVDVPDKKPVTLVQGLRKAIDSEGAGDIGVVQRGEETYLVRQT